MVRAKSSEVSVFRIILTLGLSASFEESFENKQTNLLFPKNVPGVTASI